MENNGAGGEHPLIFKEMKLGEKFNDEDEAKQFINEENFCEFIVSTNNKKSLYFHCKHSRKSDYTGNGLREGQHL